MWGLQKKGPNHQFDIGWIYGEKTIMYAKDISIHCAYILYWKETCQVQSTILFFCHLKIGKIGDQTQQTQLLIFFSPYDAVFEITYVEGLHVFFNDGITCIFVVLMTLVFF